MNKKSMIIIVFEVISVFILYCFVNSQYLELVPECLIYNTTGLLCPACGGTRCIKFLLQGNWLHAFYSHIIFFIVIIYLLIINIIYLVNINRKEKVATCLYPKYWHIIIFAILLIFYTIMRNLL